MEHDAELNRIMIEDRRDPRAHRREHCCSLSLEQKNDVVSAGPHGPGAGRLERPNGDVDLFNRFAQVVVRTVALNRVQPTAIIFAVLPRLRSVQARRGNARFTNTAMRHGVLRTRRQILFGVTADYVEARLESGSLPYWSLFSDVTVDQGSSRS
ncbi:MAG: hypothetical protein MZU97_21545 [Bacillus subtilis]|nr:hypothetical protein [Bacillus subtilis]